MTFPEATLVIVVAEQVVQLNDTIPAGVADHVIGKVVFTEYTADVHKGFVPLGLVIVNDLETASQTELLALILPYPISLFQVPFVRVVP
jgi:hypothetical protein